MKPISLEFCQKQSAICNKKDSFHSNLLDNSFEKKLYVTIKRQLSIFIRERETGNLKHERHLALFK